MGKHWEWQEEFDMAGRILASEPGELVIANDPYVAFRYLEPSKIRIVFYPHKTSAGNYHMRVRNEGSRDASRADELMVRLDIGAGHNCTFQRRHTGVMTGIDYAREHDLEFGWARP